MQFSTKASYGLGIFGPMLGWVAALQYLMYFYTEIVGLSAPKAGLIYLMGMVWDAVSDPLIGAIADRTKTRWGRYRPYLLFGSVPYGATIALLFTPPGGSEQFVFIAALVAHLLFRTGYTLVYMPYTAMIARMTSNYDDRTDLTAFKTFFVFTANLCVSFGFYTFVMAFGNGSESKGFPIAAALIGCMAVVTSLLCFAWTEEKDVHVAGRHSNENFSLRNMGGDLLSNRPFLLIFSGVAVFGGFYGAELALIPYFAKYWFNDASLARILFTSQAIFSLASIPLWLWLSRRYGKKTVWITGASLASIGLIAIYLLASKSIWLTAVLYGINNAGATAFIMVFYAMTADTVDWGEWRTGRRQEGVIFGAISFANKCAAGLVTGIVGAALAWVGFVSDQAQSIDTLNGMRMIGLLIPATAFLISAALMAPYPITRRRHADIIAGRVTDKLT